MSELILLGKTDLGPYGTQVKLGPRPKLGPGPNGTQARMGRVQMGPRPKWDPGPNGFGPNGTQAQMGRARMGPRPKWAWPKWDPGPNGPGPIGTQAQMGQAQMAPWPRTFPWWVFTERIAQGNKIDMAKYCVWVFCHRNHFRLQQPLF